ncbi:transglycosylase domain-containing protein [Paenibacillus sp. GCM10012307]|uniref:Transglycosylase domain-containing protein n=1 Tax=Paenibacillus roseus TaxID=2798579 RepID=A0A934MWL4_9BACL|nr:transglycosylase domain-containing protein [Paenibacillus roseus]MBJ6363267.1 transglycosylase domain-containing protein [Paenibacillus roseus]
MNDDRQKPTSGRNGWLTFGLVMWITVKWLFIFGLTAGLFAGGAVTGYVASLVKEEPLRPRSVIEEKINENVITGFAYFSDGTPIGQLRTEEDRRLVEIDSVPKQVIDALLAVEDNNFESHKGVDLNGLGRAVKQKFLNEDTQTGGSTLTQQLARRVFLNLDVTDARKIKEIFLSLRMERYLTKPQILTAYLNKMPFGNGSNGYQVFGIKAASKGIFNITDLNQLNIAQSAYLAGLPQLPSVYSAFNGKGEFNEKGFNRAIERQKRVLARMLETGRITNAQYNEALKFEVKPSLAKPAKKAYSTYPYLMLETERKAAEVLLLQSRKDLTKEDLNKPENKALIEEARLQLLHGGYRVYTTIDRKAYSLMKNIAADKDNFTPDSAEKGVEQIAAMMINHKTGAILSMLEGRDFYLEQMNYATQMTRQPGSAMKPIAAYLPALDTGKIQPGGIIDDAPIVLKDGTKGFHIPKNANNRYDGLVTARDALNRSLNLPALKLFLDDVTIPKAWDFTKKLGITTIQESDYHASTGVIGGLAIGVSVEELTNAYGAIPNHGVFNDAYMIEKITDSSGKTVYEHKLQPQQVFSEQTAFLMTDMLRTVVSSPSGTGYRLTSWFKNYNKIPIAGKTGSTQNYADVWFMGFTPDITLGVWAGYEKQAHVLTKGGRDRARTIWAKIMNDVTDAKPEWFASDKFEQPDGIVKATVSGYSGKKPTQLTTAAGKLVTDWFNKEFLPKENDDAILTKAFIRYNGVNYLPQPETPKDFVQEQTVIVRKKPLDELMEEIQAAQAKMPESSRKPLSYYLPRDANNDAPSKVDPRKDDGKAPSAPTDVVATVAGSSVNISFKSSPEADVVGYRLYRSTDNPNGYQNSGSVLLSGEGTTFVSSMAGASRYNYYVTAVDVSGKESVPSSIVSTSGIIPDSPNEGTDEPANPGDNQPVNEPGTEPGDGTPPRNNSESGQHPDDQPAKAPSVPKGLHAEATDLGFRITWEANPSSDNVTTYNVYYSENGRGKFTKIGSTSQNRFEYVSPAGSGSFRITASNDYGESATSAVVKLN